MSGVSLQHPIQVDTDHKISVEQRLFTGITSSSASANTFYNCLVAYNNKPLAVDDNLREAVRYYEIKRPIGFALLLGNNHCPNMDSLPITRDLRLMQSVLRESGWDVSNPYAIKPHMTVEECDDALKILGNLDTYSCFMFYYSGHGDANGLLLHNGYCKSYADIVQTVSKIDCLRGKPKIFIFDSCRVKPAHTSFKSEIERANAKIHNYPPPDTLICFSANEGMESFSHDDHGSFFTDQLSRKLKSFGHRLSFTEIVTLTNGGVMSCAKKSGRKQQPVMYSTLNSILLLNDDPPYFQGSNEPSEQHYQAPMEVSDEQGNTTKKFVYLPTFNTRSKGPNHHGNLTHLQNDVVTDAIGQHQTKHTFKTKEDVINNLPSLGQGVSVFVCYAPDPESPYNDPSSRQDIITSNSVQVAQLCSDLERLGFTVISDLHLGDTQPRNWLQWYVSRIELCDYLIMVCSPAFKELFSCEKPKFPIKDERASWFLTYRNAMYAEIIREVSNSPSGSKFVPIILHDHWAPEDCVPSLLATASQYHLGPSTDRREFKFDEKYGSFEQLVCRMAGIDRHKMNESSDQGVYPLAPPYSQAAGIPLAQPISMKPPRGYKAVPWVPKTKVSQDLPPLTQASQPPVVSQPSKPPQASQPPLVSQLSKPPQASQPPSASQPSQPPYVPPSPSSLPNKPPARSVILWLCNKITSWRFVARFLEIESSEIERIAIDHRDHGVMEQRFQMFESWKRHESREYSYHTLGDVLLQCEPNKHLYPEFCKKVLSAEQE